MRDSRRIYAIDPGRVCGFSVGKGQFVDYFGQAEYFDFLEQFSHEVQPEDLVVLERVDPRRWDNDTKLTVEVTGAVKFIVAMAAVDLLEVNASDKKKTMTDVSIHTRSGHARDAEAIRLWALRYGKW